MKRKIITFKSILWLLSLIVVFVVAFFIGKSNRSYAVDAIADNLKMSITNRISESMHLNARKLVLMENPELIKQIMKGGSFGNKNFSVPAAQNMFSRDPKVVEDVMKKTTIEEVAKGIWFIRLPFVNVTLIDTKEGLVLVDTGMEPAGPAVLKAIRSVSKKHIHTILYTHGHVDHSYGTWALTEAGEHPEIIAQKNIKERFRKYIRLRGLIARYMSQPVDQLPKDSADIIWPTRYFDDSLSLDIGGVRLKLMHYRGETDDQFFVWLPDSKTLLSADYYQGFLPNAGNGKREQRYVGDWIKAFGKMVSLKPQLLLPSHGVAVTDPQIIQKDLTVTAAALEYIYDKTIEGLNAGLRRDQIFQSIQLPERFKKEPVLQPKYVSAKDISKMIIKQYEGWWNDIPSDWSPAPLEKQAEELVKLSGGIDKLVEHTRKLTDENLALAASFADWAFLSDPDSPEVQQLVMDIYRRRILSPDTYTQEKLVYLDHMADVRARMK